MKIELDSPAADRNIIQAYSNEGIVINNVPYRGSLIVCPDRIIERWPPRSASELADAHLSDIIALTPELVLVGTGRQLQFPDPQITLALQSANIGVEVMDTAAACRAYNFIAGEGRRVVAALMAIGI